MASSIEPEKIAHHISAADSVHHRQACRRVDHEVIRLDRQENTVVIACAYRTRIRIENANWSEQPVVEVRQKFHLIFFCFIIGFQILAVFFLNRYAYFLGI